MPTDVGITLNASNCGSHFETEAVLLVTLLPWPLTFQPLNGVTSHPCFPLSVFSLLRTGQTDGQTDDSHQCLMPPPYGGVGIKKFAFWQWHYSWNRTHRWQMSIAHQKLNPMLCRQLSDRVLLSHWVVCMQTTISNVTRCQTCISNDSCSSLSDEYTTLRLFSTAVTRRR